MEVEVGGDNSDVVYDDGTILSSNLNMPSTGENIVATFATVAIPHSGRSSMTHDEQQYIEVSHPAQYSAIEYVTVAKTGTDSQPQEPQEHHLAQSTDLNGDELNQFYSLEQTSDGAQVCVLNVKGLNTENDLTKFSIRTVKPNQSLTISRDDFEHMPKDGIYFVGDKEPPQIVSTRRTRRSTAQAQKRPKAGTKENEADTSSDPAPEVDSAEDDDDGEKFRDNKSRYAVVIYGFSCSFDGCESELPNRKALHDHISKVHFVEPYPCVIEGCDERFMSKNGLSKHLANKHSNIQVFKCTICETTHTSYNRLWTHLYSLHELGRFGCSYQDCEFVSTTRKGVYNHIAHRHAQLKIKCSRCDAMFAVSSDLERHLSRFHLELRPFKCNLCSYDTNIRSTIHRHIRAVHFNMKSGKATKGEPHPQDYYTVSYEAKNVIAVVKPLADTTKNNVEHLFECRFCDKSFKRNYNLIVHERIHQGIGMFRCTYNSCHQTFVRRAAGLLHIQKDHFKRKIKRKKDSYNQPRKKGDKKKGAAVQHRQEDEEDGEGEDGQECEDTDAEAINYLELLPQIVEQQPAAAAMIAKEEPSQEDTFVEDFSAPDSHTHDSQAQIVQIVVHSEPDSERKTGQASHPESLLIASEVAESIEDETTTNAPLTSFLIQSSIPDTKEELLEDLVEETISDANNEHNYEKSPPPPTTTTTRRSRSNAEYKHKIVFVCRYGGCQRQFSRPGLLAQHHRTHLDIRPFYCCWSDMGGVCSFTASRKENVIQHIRLKHFKLPRSMKAQKDSNIDNPTDFLKYVGVEERLLVDPLGSEESIVESIVAPGIGDDDLLYSDSIPASQQPTEEEHQVEEVDDEVEEDLATIESQSEVKQIPLEGTVVELSDGNKYVVQYRANADDADEQELDESEKCLYLVPITQ